MQVLLAGSGLLRSHQSGLTAGPGTVSISLLRVPLPLSPAQTLAAEARASQRSRHYFDLKSPLETAGVSFSSAHPRCSPARVKSHLLPGTRPEGPNTPSQLYCPGFQQHTLLFQGKFLLAQRLGPSLEQVLPAQSPSLLLLTELSCQVLKACLCPDSLGLPRSSLRERCLPPIPTVASFQ